MLEFTTLSQGTRTPSQWLIIELALGKPLMVVTDDGVSVTNPNYEGNRHCLILHPTEHHLFVLHHLQQLGLVDSIEEE